MEGFTKLPKMQCFKEGGNVKVKKMCGGGSYKKGGEVEKGDIEQDKKMIKKAFKQHDKAEHDKSEPTEIKLKKGGRSKKEVGTVKKYKTGGSVENVYGAKKKAGDLDRIEKTKDIKPGKAAAPSKAEEKPTFKGSDVSKTNKMPAGDKDKIKKVAPTGDKKAAAASGAKEMANKYKKGGEVKKFADGRSTGVPSAVQNAVILKDLENQRMADRAKNALKYLGPAQQSQFINQGGMNPSPMTSNIGAGNPGGMPGGSTIPGGQKRGGKVKKYAPGGKIGKIAAGLFPGALFGLPTAAAIYSNEKAKDAKVEEEAAAKDKEAETKSAPVAKKRGGKATKVC